MPLPVSPIFQIVDLSRLFRQQFEKVVTESGLDITAGEARTLLYAAKASPIRQSALAERMQVEPMSLSNFLDRLERRGLVARRPDPDDGRAKQVEVTPAAAPLIARLKELAGRIFDHAAGDLTVDERERLQLTLESLRTKLAAELRPVAAEAAQ